MRIVVAETGLMTAYMPQEYWTLYEVNTNEVDPVTFACSALGIDNDEELSYVDYIDLGVAKVIDSGDRHHSYANKELWFDLEDKYGKGILDLYLDNIGVRYDKIYYEDELLEQLGL